MGSGSVARSPAPRAFAVGFAIVLMAALFVIAVPRAGAAPGGAPDPSAVVSVTLVLDKTSYVSGENATATAIVYRTPAPANYSYDWRVEDLFGGMLASLANGTSTYRYPIPIDFQGFLRFRVTVDDHQGNIAFGVRTTTVAVGYVSLTLNRSEYNPGDRIDAFFSLSSRVITTPTWAYDVMDQAGTSVLSGNTTGSSFFYTVPNPASSFYSFSVVASQANRSASAALSISQAGGYLLSATFDKPSYAPGDTVRVRVSLITRGTASLPSQFRFSAGFFGVPPAAALTTVPSTDLFVTVPLGTGGGDLLLLASESMTGATTFQTIHIGGTSSFWSTDVGGIPVFAVFLSFLFVLLLIAVLALWRRTGGGGWFGSHMPPGQAPPPPPAGPMHTSGGTPMSVICTHCGKPIDITTSKRPIEVMCPSCGETQLVT